MSVTVAVDANGADLGPVEVAAGAAIAARQGVRVVLFGPAEAFGSRIADLCCCLEWPNDLPPALAMGETSTQRR